MRTVATHDETPAPGNMMRKAEKDDQQKYDP
jgi:hypothetical protein